MYSIVSEKLGTTSIEGHTKKVILVVAKLLLQFSAL